MEMFFDFFYRMRLIDFEHLMFLINVRIDRFQCHISGQKSRLDKQDLYHASRLCGTSCVDEQIQMSLKMKVQQY